MLNARKGMLYEYIFHKLLETTSMTQKTPFEMTRYHLLSVRGCFHFSVTLSFHYNFYDKKSRLIKIRTKYDQKIDIISFIRYNAESQSEFFQLLYSYFLELYDRASIQENDLKFLDLYSPHTSYRHKEPVDITAKSW